MSNKSGVSSQVISLPQGGGALSGLGEKFSPDLHTGTGNFTVPIAVPPGRNGFQPQLSLSYSTGGGNSPFGLGWSLSVPGVTRKTSKGIPKYLDASDVFVLSGAEDLVPVAGATAIGATRYRPRTEGLFARIDHHRPTDDDASNYWEVRSKDGLISLYGTPVANRSDPDAADTAAVIHPDYPERIFAWKLSRTTDPFGNRIEYLYTREEVQDDGPHHWDQVYLSQIRYVDYPASGDEGDALFLITVDFTYEDRPDPFSEYRASFEVRTVKRCTQISISTHAGEDRLFKTYDLVYLDQHDLPHPQLPLNGVSLLSQVKVRGHDGEPTQDMPPLEFGYTPFEPKGRRYQPLSAPEKNLPASSLSSGDLELADLFGHGLPDIFQLGDQVRYWRNLGNGTFDFPRTMTYAPAGVKLADSGVQLADMNGDGRIDLLVTTDSQSGYYPLSFQGGFDSRGFVKYQFAPSFNLEAPNVRFVDLDGDGVIDALRTDVGFDLFYNDRLKGWNKVERRARRQADDFPDVSFQDPRVKLADMSGDGLQDIVLVHNGRIEYWPSLGYGRWGKKVTMANSPVFADASNFVGTGFDPKRLLLGDVDGDGLADIVYVGPNYITVWINQCGNGWSDPITVRGTPPASDMDAVRLADMLGNGTSGILWSYDFNPMRDSAYKFLDLTGGVKPYVLTSMDNHMGSVTRVEYTSSTHFYLQDQKKIETRWVTALPFPVQVVSKVEVIDVFSSSKLTTVYHYHHGYWDGAEREFRGFGRVDQRDSQGFYPYHADGLFSSDDFESVSAEHFTPPTETRTWFHQGPVGDEFGAWSEADFSHEYWSGDPRALSRPTSMATWLNTLPRRARRDAFRTLRGRVLRTELFALDGSTRQDKPYTVTEHLHVVSAVATPEEVWPGTDSSSTTIFLPLTIAERTTQWERGNEPLTQLTFTGDFDDYGQARRKISIAVPRTIDYRAAHDEATESYLSTCTRTDFAQRVDSSHFQVDRVARTTSYEVVNDGTMSAFQLRAAIEVETATLSVIGQELCFYDGDAFVGLDYGELGDYGALSRKETLVLTPALLQDAYRSGLSLTEPPELPPYLDPEGPTDWTDEYPDGFRDSILEDRPEDGPAILAGYIYREEAEDSPYLTGYYVNSERKAYDFQQEGSGGVGRGLTAATKDPLDHESSIAYDHLFSATTADSYLYLPTGTTDPVALSTRAVYDPRVLQPVLTTDPNGNRTAYSFSPLGLLSTVAVMGKDSDEDGDTLEHPGTVYQYNFTAYDDSAEEDREPVYVHVTKRVRHYWDLYHEDAEIDFPEDEVGTYPERFIQSRSFSDGAGRVLQTRAQAEDVIFGSTPFGDSNLPLDQSDPGDTAEGQVRDEEDPPRVTVSGWQVYDNKGQVVEKYEPFFSDGWAFAPATEEQVSEKVAIYYDPRGHAIRTVNPDGSEQRVVFGIPDDLTDPDTYAPTPWESYTYDANDNAGRTHEESSSGYSSHWNTPANAVVDALGRTVLAVQRNGDDETDEFRTRSTYDMRGNLLTVMDPLSRIVFQHVYDLANRPCRVENIDAGVRRTVLDSVGNEIERRDSKGALLLQAYDVLNRPLFRWARNDSDASMTLRERPEYADAGDPEQDSEEREAAAALNALGKPMKHYDEAGLLTFDSYDFKGNLLQKTRKTISDSTLMTVFEDPEGDDWETAIPAFAVDWQPSGEDTLEDLCETLLDPYAYQTDMTYDALNRVVTMRYPEDVDGSESRKLLTHTYNRAGALETVQLGGTTYIRHIAYNAKGQRILIAYGNGIMTRYAYDPQTIRLARMRSEPYSNPEGEPYTFTVDEEADPLQDLGYSYDLAGNPLCITDVTPGCGVRDNPDSINAPTTALAALMGSGDALLRRFAYDPTYRLVSSTGRECADIGAPRSWADVAPCGYYTASTPTPNQANAKDLTAFYKETYEYDPAGNMQKLRHSNPGGEPDNVWVRYMGMGGNNYSDWTDLWPDHQGEYAPWDDAPGNKLTHVGDDSDSSPQSHFFDENGNLIQEGESRHFEWDHADRLRVFRTQTDGSEPSVYAFYLYDAAGRRVKKLVRKQGGQLEATVYVDEVYERHYQRLESDDPGDPNDAENNTLHLMDNQSRVALVRVGAAFDDDAGPAVQYHLADHLGSSVVVLDDGGSWVNREEFSAYGETMFGGFARKRYRFTGKERDEESGLSYHGARHYAPWLARWIRSDPKMMADGNNVYLYAKNSPARLIDPGGTASEQPPQAQDNIAQAEKKESNSKGETGTGAKEGARPGQEKSEKPLGKVIRVTQTGDGTDAAVAKGAIDILTHIDIANKLIRTLENFAARSENEHGGNGMSIDVQFVSKPTPEMLEGGEKGTGFFSPARPNASKYTVSVLVDKGHQKINENDHSYVLYSTEQTGTDKPPTGRSNDMEGMMPVTAEASTAQTLFHELFHVYFVNKYPGRGTGHDSHHNFEPEMKAAMNEFTRQMNEYNQAKRAGQ